MSHLHLDSIKMLDSSMFPLIQTGDTIYYRKTLFSAIKQDDIIVIYKNKMHFTCRVVYKTNTYLITKSDALHNINGKSYAHQIIGRAYRIERNSETFQLETQYIIQSSFYAKEITSITMLLQSHQIPFVFLKGLPLHLHYAKSIPKRIYYDCDILIAPQALQEVELLFHKANYSVIQTAEELSKDQNKPEITFRKLNSQYPVLFDVHVEPLFLMIQITNLDFLYPPHLIQKMTLEYIKMRKMVRVQDNEIPILDCCHLIPYLALHLFHHTFQGYHRFYLLDLIIKKEIEKLESIKERSQMWKDMAIFIKKYQLQNYIYPVFLLTKKYYQSPIPISMLTDIEPKNNLVKNYLIHYISTIEIFNDRPRISAGIERFKLLFFLSPTPFHYRIRIFFQLAILRMIFILGVTGLKSFFGKYKLLHQFKYIYRKK